MKHTLAMTLLVCTALGAPSLAQTIAQDGPTNPTDLSAPEAAPGNPTAPGAAPAAAVRTTQDGVCLEPGHPAYNTSTIVASHPSMRACIAAGGRRDAPSDALSFSSTQPQGAADIANMDAPRFSGALASEGLAQPPMVFDMESPQDNTPDGTPPENVVPKAQNAPVRITQDGVCLEPGHHAYNTSTIVGHHPNMRACVAAGGRRDAPSDGLSFSSPQQQVTPGTPVLPPSGFPGAFASEGLAQPPMDITMEGEQEAAPAPAPAKPPRGIALSDPLSYSQDPAIFQPPDAYIGRSSAEFLP